MNSPIISVIVPIFNAEKYLNYCINSLVSQTYMHMEFILVDDGSTDESSKICDEWARKDERVKVIHKENNGASSARNTGLEIAKGEYLGFIDADDYIDVNMYETLLEELLEYNADAARCAIVRESPTGYREEWGRDDAPIMIVEKKQLLCDIGEANGILPVSPCNKLYSRKCIGDIRFDETLKYAEDTLFNFEVGMNINTMVYHDVCRYHYVVNSESASHRQFDEHRFDEHRVMDAIIELSPKEIVPYCIKGDVLKSLRTIKEMLRDNACMNSFYSMRKRILLHKSQIFLSSIYSVFTKLRVLLLWLFPSLYKIIVKKHAVRAEKNYADLSGVKYE